MRTDVQDARELEGGVATHEAACYVGKREHTCEKLLQKPCHPGFSVSLKNDVVRMNRNLLF